MKAPHISPQFIRFSGRATYPSFCCISPCQNAARQLSPYPTRQRLDCEIPSMAALVTSSPCSNRLPVCRPSWHSCKNSSRAACHPDQRCPARIILSRLLARAVNNHISYYTALPATSSDLPAIQRSPLARRTPAVSLVPRTTSFPCLPVIIRRHKWRSSKDAEIQGKMGDKIWQECQAGDEFGGS